MRLDPGSGQLDAFLELSPQDRAKAVVEASLKANSWLGLYSRGWIDDRSVFGVTVGARIRW